MRQSSVTRDRPWGWPEIKYELARRGLSLSALAAKHGVTPQAFAKVKRRTSRPAQAAIAKAIGVHPENIWPARYRNDERRRA
jgi:Ner family transcriptional regulator